MKPSRESVEALLRISEDAAAASPDVQEYAATAELCRWFLAQQQAPAGESARAEAEACWLTIGDFDADGMEGEDLDATAIDVIARAIARVSAAASERATEAERERCARIADSGECDSYGCSTTKIAATAQEERP